MAVIIFWRSPPGWYTGLLKSRLYSKFVSVSKSIGKTSISRDHTKRPATSPRLQLSPVRPPSAMELAQSESRAAMRAAGEVATAVTSRSCGLPSEPQQGSADGGRYGATRA